MVVLIDICHTPQFNFYKPLVKRLSDSGDKVLLTVMNRGRLLKIANHEVGDWPGVEVVKMGNHRMNRLSVIFESNFLRIFQMLFWGINKNIDIVYGNGFIPHILGRLKRIPRYAFDDDPDTIDFTPKKWLCTESNYCLWKEPDKLKKTPSNVKVLKSLKEWAYLSPSVFKPNVGVLKTYDVEPKEYIFVREVTVGTINYVGQQADSILQISDKFPKGMKVLLSLEKKDKKDQYPKDWILLQEPLEDVHSLIYYSAGLISSGDSMAREAALLGVPAYYLGIRFDMPANEAANEVADLQNQKTMPVEEWLDRLTENHDATERQIKMRKYINETFTDVNDYMFKLILKEKNKERKQVI